MIPRLHTNNGKEDILRFLEVLRCNFEHAQQWVIIKKTKQISQIENNHTETNETSKKIILGREMQT